MRLLSVLILLALTVKCWANPMPMNSDCPNQFSAKLVSLQGKLFFDPDGKGQWQSAHLDETLCEGSRLRVEAYSRASILLPDNVVLRLDEGTVLTLNGMDSNKPTLLALLKGFVHFISRTPKSLQITSPIANAGPEGTEFAMSVNEHTAGLWVYEGAVTFFNPQGKVRLMPGQGAQAEVNQKPTMQITLS
ncbi:FecR family protein, partial [Methylocucumis oryzae]